jgi:hypothetical protein
MQYASEALELEGVKESREDARELAAMYSEYRAMRCSFMAESQECILKLSEACVLYKHTMQIAEESIRHQKTRNATDSRATKQIAKGIQSMTVSEKEVAKGLCL